MGLNLQEANHVIHLTRWWNPAVEDQATCRAYRTGQKKDVFVYYFVAEHPFEKNLNERIKQKRALRSNLFDLEYVTPIKAEILLSQFASE
jgi:SNF2 family DNA or RNA helicase